MVWVRSARTRAAVPAPTLGSIMWLIKAEVCSKVGSVAHSPCADIVWTIGARDACSLAARGPGWLPMRLEVTFRWTLCKLCHFCGSRYAGATLRLFFACVRGCTVGAAGGHRLETSFRSSARLCCAPGRLPHSL